jgi:peroxiredoxin
MQDIISGKTFRLSDLRGQPVLVQFRVSWQPPCRANNHQLKELFSTFYPKDLEIFAISFDHQQRFRADTVKVDERPRINNTVVRGITPPVAKIFNLNPG